MEFVAVPPSLYLSLCCSVSFFDAFFVFSVNNDLYKLLWLLFTRVDFDDYDFIGMRVSPVRVRQQRTLFLLEFYLSNVLLSERLEHPLVPA